MYTPGNLKKVVMSLILCWGEMAKLNIKIIILHEWCNYFKLFTCQFPIIVSVGYLKKCLHVNKKLKLQNKNTSLKLT